MAYFATQKYIVNSPRKLREVATMIKKLKPVDAIERLPFTNKAAAEPLMKVIKTAVANAKQKSVNPEDLVFTEIQIGEGPRLKRFRAGSRGRAKPYKRRMSHIRVVLDVLKKEEVKPEALKVNEKTETIEIEKKKIIKPSKKTKK